MFSYFKVDKYTSILNHSKKRPQKFKHKKS
jgi:hypothetical protein